MGFLKRLLGKREGGGDPTADWPDPGPLPIVLPFHGALGDLRFGCPLAAARTLGRPSRFRNVSSGFAQLLYAGAGYLIEFDHESKLNYLALLIDHHEGEPEDDFSFATPEVMLADGQTATLDRKSTREDIERHFGPPAEVDEDSEEILLRYQQGPLEMEFELHPSRRTLARWNLFAT